MSEAKEDSIKVGEIYEVNHRRSGSFKLFVERQDEDWVTGTIVEGVATASMGCNAKKQFEQITIRKSFCTFNISR